MEELENISEVKELNSKPKRAHRWLIIAGIAGALVGVIALAAWQFKWYQPALDRYNQASVSIKVREGDTFMLENAVIALNGKSFTTDKNGKVSFTVVAGTYQSVVSKDGYQEKQQELVIKRGSNDLIYVALQKLPDKVYAVKGFVQDYVSGNPLVNVQVGLGTKTVQTDPSGGYVFEKVVPAEIKLTLSKAGYLDKEMKITVSDSDSVTAKIPLVPTGRVVFVSNRDGRRGLYASDFDGNDQRLFVEANAGGEDFAPNFSPKNNQIVFSSTREKMKSSYGEDLVKLYIVSQDGKQLKKISNDVAPSFDPLWSPDSSFVYFTGYTTPKLDVATYHIYDVAKSSILDIGEAAYSATFSPDGSTVAYYINSNEDKVTTDPVSGTTTTSKVFLNVLKSYNLRTGERKVLAKQEQAISDIRFSSNSKAASYEVVLQEVRRRYEVSLIDSKEIEIPVLAQAKRRFVISPNGTKKAFIEVRDGKTDLYIVSTDDSNEKRLTTLGVVTTQLPVWDNESRNLTFAIKREAENALYIASTEGGDPKKITDFYSDSVRPN